MAEIKADETVDITDKVCPLTFVKAKVTLDELDDGEVLAIRMNDGAECSEKYQGRRTPDLKAGGQRGRNLYVIREKGGGLRMAARIGKADFEEKVLQSDRPVIVDFYSDSCVACKKLSPLLGDVEDDYEDRLYVYKVNTNFDGELAEEYDVTANPTLLFVKDGVVKDRSVGAVKPAELTAWVEKNL